MPAAELVDASLAAVESAAAARGVELEAQVVDIAVQADADRVVRALVELIGNAIRFSEPNGLVMLRVSGEGDMAHFWISDRGCGIRSDRLGSIFDRIHRPDESKTGGSGSGLAIATRAVELHGGSIWVESEEGVGATFSFTIPVGDRAPKPALSRRR